MADSENTTPLPGAGRHSTFTPAGRGETMLPTSNTGEAC